MRRRIVLAALLVAAAAAGAWFLPFGSKRISVTPPASRPANPLPEPPVSTIAIPLGVSMKELESLARTRLPEEISGSNPVRESLFDGRGTYLVQRDGEPDVRVDGDRLVLSVPITFKARLNGTGTALGLSVPVSLSADGAATVELSMKPSISPDWKVHTQPRILLRWKRAPGSRILGVRVTFQNAADEFLRSRIEEALPRIDAALNESLELERRAEAAWKEIQEPALVSTSPDLWMTVLPLSVTLPPLDLGPDRVLLDARLETRLALDTKEPPQAGPTPLPSVSTAKTGSAGTGFTLQLPVFLGYEAINRKLETGLAGRNVNMGPGKSLTIEKAAMSASGERLVLAVGIRAVEGAGFFSTRRAGTIYVSGTPRWDRDREEIRLESVGFDEGTMKGLLGTAAWIGRPILLESLRQAAVFPLSGPAADARKALGRILEKQKISSDLTVLGSARQVVLESVAVTETGLALLVRAEGTASLEWAPGSR